MKNMIIFDSDFVISNIASLKEYLDKFVNYECYVCDVSLKEIAKKNSFDKIGMINNFRTTIKNYKNLGIEFKNGDETIKSKIEEESINYVKAIFGDNVILNHSRTSTELLKRAYNKIPPFGKSDTGFKDTIILLDIIDYLKGKKIKKAFFVTNDDDFNKNNSDIEKEAKDCSSCEFTILDGKNKEKLLNYFNIGNDKEIEELSEKINDLNINILELRKDLNDICYNLFHFKGYDPYDGEEYVGNNFVIHQVISKETIMKFLTNLDINIKKNIFNTNLVISEFFDDIFLFSKEKNIDINIFEKLNNIYKQIRENKDYLDALLNLLISNFNELVKSNKEDLPF